MPPPPDTTPPGFESTTVQVTPKDIVIEAVKNNATIKVIEKTTTDKKIALLPDGNDKVTIRVTIKDDEGNPVTLPNDRKVKFEVKAQSPDVDINGGTVSSSQRNNDSQARNQVKDIYKNVHKTSLTTANKLAGIAPHTNYAHKVIPIGTMSETEKATQNGQAEITYTAPNLGGNQSNPAVDRVTATLPAQAGSTELKENIDIQLSCSLNSVAAAKRLKLVTNGEGYSVGGGGRHANQRTINNIKKAGKIWKAIRSRDKDMFPHIRDAYYAIDDAKKALVVSDYGYCWNCVGKALQQLDEAKKVYTNAKVNGDSISDNLQIVRNDKDRITYAHLPVRVSAIGNAEEKLIVAKNEVSAIPEHPSKAESDLEGAFDEIELAYKNLEFVDDRPERFAITSLSLTHGGLHAPHKTHRDGKDVDVGLMGPSGGKRHVPKLPQNERTTVVAAKKYWRGTWTEGSETRTYDRPLTRLLIEVFKDAGATQILIHDANISKDTIIDNDEVGHHHHIHVDFD